MPFGQELVEFQRLISRLLHERQRGLDGAGRERLKGHEPIRLCQACVRRGKLGIFLDNLLKQLSRCLRVGCASPAQPCARLEIENVGIDIGVVPPLARACSQSKLVDDRPRDLILNSEHVMELAIVLLGPQRNIPRDLNQFGVDAQPVAGPQDGPLQDQIRSKLLTHLAHVARLILECKRRRSRAHLQALNAREAADDFIRQTIDKLVVRPALR